MGSQVASKRVEEPVVTLPVSLLRLLLFGPPKELNTPDHPRYDPSRDENWEPKRWSDPTYLGDGPWGA